MALLLLLLGCSRGRETDQADAAPPDSAAADSAKTASEGDSKKSRKGKDKEEEKKDERLPVDTVVLGRGPIESVIRASSNLSAERQVMVLAEAARHVTDLVVEEGDRVRKGDVLCRLKDDEQRSTLARVTTLLEKADREFERQTNLFQRDLTSEEALNNARDELATQKLAFGDAKRELSYTEVRSPIAGTVTRRLVNLGNQVAPGQELFEVVDFESLVAVVYIPEKSLAEVKEGLPVRVTARAVRAASYPASIQRIAPVVDPRTGTVKVTVGVGGQEGLRPGLYADVEIVTDVDREALLIPKRALVYDNDRVFVYRLKPSREVERTLVVPALMDADWVAPALGFAEGDTIVIAGQAGLKDGAKVELVSERDAKAAAEEESAKGETP